MSDDTITTVRDIQRSLAAAIRGMGADDGLSWPDGVKAPLVFLDGISDEWEPAPEEEDAPLVVIAGTGDTVPAWGGDCAWTVEVLVAMDCSSRFANCVPSQDPGDGVRVAGEGDLFQAVVNAVTNIVRLCHAGAILKNIDRRWSFHSLPVQFATLTLDYTAPGTYDDGLPVTY